MCFVAKIPPKWQGSFYRCEGPGTQNLEYLNFHLQAVENKNLRLLEAGSHPDHILFGSSNGFNHANSTEQKKPSTRADGRDRGW